MGRGHTTCTVPCQTSTRRTEGGYERKRTSSGRLAGSSVFFTWLYALKSGWMQNTKHCRIALITVPQPTRMGSHKSIAQHNVAALSAHTRQGESPSTGWAHQACAHVQHEERGPAIGRVHEPEIATHFVLHLLPPKFEGHDHKAEASAERTRSPVKVSCGLGVGGSNGEHAPNVSRQVDDVRGICQVDVSPNASKDEERAVDDVADANHVHRLLNLRVADAARRWCEREPKRTALTPTRVLHVPASETIPALAHGARRRGWWRDSGCWGSGRHRGLSGVCVVCVHASASDVGSQAGLRQASRRIQQQDQPRESERPRAPPLSVRVPGNSILSTFAASKRAGRWCRFFVMICCQFCIAPTLHRYDESPTLLPRSRPRDC